jgi:DNA-directed RNA polymerase I subunit RPA2
MAETLGKFSDGPAQVNHQRLMDLVMPHVGSFDFFFNPGLSRMLANMDPVDVVPPVIADAPAKPRVTLWYEEITVGMPSLGPKELMPNTCREMGISYTASLEGTLCRLVEGDDTVDKVHRKLGNIPIMVMSNRCHLRGLSSTQLIAAKEESCESGGYFIINGNERCMRLLIVPKRNYVTALYRSSLMNRGPAYTPYLTSIRCVRPDQSSQTVSLHYLQGGLVTARVMIRRREYFIPRESSQWRRKKK